MTNGNFENTMLDGALVSRLRRDIEDLFSVTSVEVPRQLSPANSLTLLSLDRRNQNKNNVSQGTVVFVGELLNQNSETVYEQIAKRWLTHNYTPILRRYKGQIGLIAQPGVVVPQPSNPWINFWLAVATIMSITLIGAVQECACMPATLSDWLAGIPMMLVMMTILTAHEFGHYFAARYHQVAVTLPYFIPLPIPGISPVGTLGAVIQLRSPFKTKKQLFDIGVAGPLAGLIFAIPFIFWVVANSPIQPLNREMTSLLEGNSIFYLLVKYVTYGQLLPSFNEYVGLPIWQEFLLLWAGILPAGGGQDILINTVGLAAWFGLLVTALNLLPVGQLDGGHVIYCLLGEKAQYLGMALIIVLIIAGFTLWVGWLLWAFITLLIIGPGHPPPLNDLVELGPIRTAMAYGMIVIFIIMFIPNPLQLL